jgi:hypothetical protein
VERKELLNINDWISVNPYNEAKLIKEKDKAYQSTKVIILSKFSSGILST